MLLASKDADAFEGRTANPASGLVRHNGIKSPADWECYRRSPHKRRRRTRINDLCLRPTPTLHFTMQFQSLKAIVVAIVAFAGVISASAIPEKRSVDDCESFSKAWIASDLWSGG